MRNVIAVAIAALLGFAAGMGGTVLLTRGGDEVVATQAPPATALRAPATADPRQPGPSELVVCLRGQGLELPDPPGPSSVTTTNRYPPEVATVAWQACRDTYTKTSGMPADQTARILELHDCMAAQGWIIAAMVGPPADTSAFNATMQKCQPRGAPAPGFAGEPPGRVELLACLRANGLDGPDAPTGPSSIAPTPQYPPEAVAAAWQACRDTWVRFSGVPADLVARSLVFPDCMAAHGWIIVAMSGPPADLNAYNAALQKCGPMVPATTAPAGQVPLSTRPS